MNTITDFKLAGVTWGTGDCKEIAKLIELVIKEGQMYRHGDVLLKPVNTTATNPKTGKEAILADGEVTGHRHVLTAPVVEDWVLDLHRYVKIAAPGKLDHPEHGKIDVAPGTYEVIIQRVYSPEAIRNVAD